MVEKFSSNGGGQVNDDLPVSVDWKPVKPPYTASSSSDSKIWANVKPFVNGALAGIGIALPLSLGYPLLYFMHPDLVTKISIPPLHNYTPKLVLKMIPSLLLRQAAYCTLQLGSFEFLTGKVEAVNKGMAPNLYQGIGCGLASGAIGASIGVPLYFAHSREAAVNANFPSLVQALYHKAANEGILALWKGGRLYAYGLMTMSVGMLASYNPSFNYLRDSVGLSETKSVLGAGIVSGFFAAACSSPYYSVANTMRNMKPDVNGKYPCTSFLDCALKILRLYGPFAFFRGSVQHFTNCTPRIMLTWYFLEKIKKMEESLGL